MAKSLSAFKGFCGIYEKSHKGQYVVFIYKYGEHYKRLDQIYVNREENIIYEFRQAIIDSHYKDELLYPPEQKTLTTAIKEPDPFKLKDLMS